MGGRGSGRRSEYGPVIDDLVRLSMDRLCRDKVLQDGRLIDSIAEWPAQSMKDKPLPIFVSADCRSPGNSTLSLRFSSGVRRYFQHFRLKRQPLKFGGCRWFAICPVTKKPVLKLYAYGGQFISREATGLNYESQREAWMFRSLRGAEKYRRKVQGKRPPPLWDFGFPDRPKGMWRSKYERIKQKAQKYEDACDAYERGAHTRIFKPSTTG